MARPQALTPAQKRQLSAQIRRGADLPALVAYAKKNQIAVSRTILGELLKATREQIAEAAAPSLPDPSELPALVVALQAEAKFLRGRLERLESAGVPRMSLLEVATLAVQVAMKKAEDPGVEPGVQVKWIGELPALMAEARRVRDAEEEINDDAGLFNPSAPAV